MRINIDHISELEHPYSLEQEENYWIVYLKDSKHPLSPKFKGKQKATFVYANYVETFLWRVATNTPEVFYNLLGYELFSPTDEIKLNKVKYVRSLVEKPTFDGYFFGELYRFESQEELEKAETLFKFPSLYNHSEDRFKEILKDSLV